MISRTSASCWNDQLARSLRVFERDDAGRLQQRQGFLEDAALGQGDG